MKFPKKYQELRGRRTFSHPRFPGLLFGDFWGNENPLHLVAGTVALARESGVPECYPKRVLNACDRDRHRVELWAGTRMTFSEEGSDELEIVRHKDNLT